jgi:hypothetical protein
MYVLTENGVLNHTGIHINTEIVTLGRDATTTVKRVLRKISEQIYRYIYGLSGNPSFVEYLLACYAPCRALIKDCLTDQTEYVIENGFLTDFSGINAAKATAVKIERGDAVSLLVRDRLSEPLPNGYVLSYCGAVNAVFPYRDGY